MNKGRRKCLLMLDGVFALAKCAPGGDDDCKSVEGSGKNNEKKPNKRRRVIGGLHFFWAGFEVFRPCSRLRIFYGNRTHSGYPIWCSSALIHTLCRTTCWVVGYRCFVSWILGYRCFVREPFYVLNLKE